jgi:methionyl-tRNA formyltransferase
MRVALLCATRRGLAFLNRLIELSPDSSPVVFSFREEPWEPPFLDDLQSLTVAAGGQFFETKQVGAVRWSQFWETTPLDLMLVVSWRYMIPPSVYQRPRQGTFVFHDSLLPKYRGFSPTVWAMINGEDHTGVTLFRIAEEVDAGPIVDQESVPIQPSDTIGVILDRVTGVYLALLERRLDSLLSGNAPPPHTPASEARKTTGFLGVARRKTPTI